MSDEKLLITPQTKVGELLKAYPEIEEVLIAIAPEFKKLRNPILLRTVARVTSLAQAARVGGVPVGDLVRQLRQAVGQPDIDVSAEPPSESAVSSTPPEWFRQEPIKQSHDARPLIEAGLQPIGRVLGDLESLPHDVIYELITPFEPAPLIDKARAKGFDTWTRAVSAGEYRTYFRRSPG
ncbi:MAG: DUF1858 domain-containing protein [Candidatus Zixiibacteriota bacterium]